MKRPILSAEVCKASFRWPSRNCICNGATGGGPRFFSVKLWVASNVPELQIWAWTSRLCAVLRNSGLRRFSSMGIPSHALSLFLSPSAEAPVISTKSSELRGG